MISGATQSRPDQVQGVVTGGGRDGSTEERTVNTEKGP